MSKNRRRAFESGNIFRVRRWRPKDCHRPDMSGRIFSGLRFACIKPSDQSKNIFLFPGKARTDSSKNVFRGRIVVGVRQPGDSFKNIFRVCLFGLKTGTCMVIAAR